jgi:hypothetical protein
MGLYFFLYPLRKESPAISNVFFPGPRASDRALESVPVDDPQSQGQRGSDF